MRCSACGTENDQGGKFCLECGNPLARACPTCGNNNPPTAKFCGECGSQLTADGPSSQGRPAGPPSSSPAETGPAAERRLVSVLFADLVGFTSLSENRDPEEVRDLLTRYFDTCRTLIRRYGGVVEKFIGDAVMAVWGTPTAQEDDAERSVRAALDLVKAVSELGAEVGAPDLAARAGVLTGEAAVTIGAEGQGMVAGDLVNTSARIQSVAQPATVFVGETTKRATDAVVVYEDGGSHELKGKAEPVPLWRAVRVIAGARGALKSEGLEAPFVGRDRELRTVKELFFSCADDRKAHLVSIVGIAGIGKSRLSWEFYKYFDGLPQVTWYHRGRCLAYGEGVAYWALAEMVRMRARIAEGEEAVSALEKLHATVEEHIKDPEERRWVWPRLAHLVGLEERVAHDREDLFAAWRLFFERLAEVNPVVMIFEDMQWAEASLLDFIEYLLDWSRNHPILVMTLARPELLDRRNNWGAGKRNFTSLYLEPLPPAAMEELLDGLVPGLPDDVRAKILGRAEGVPLYAMETVRMLLDRGLLALEGSAYRTTGPIEALEVPETLHALIAARLDGLSAEERRLVQDASVLGKTFLKQAAVAVTHIPEPQLDSLLNSLVRKEVLTIQADQRSPERGQYGFLQDLMRRVAYETLSKKERKARHLAMAAYLESAWGEEEEEIVEVVASHFLEAYRLAPDAPDAPEIRRRAREMLARAGERAASLAANAEAQRYFEQAAELADEPLVQAELHERAGRMAKLGVRSEPARYHLERAIEIFQSIGLTHPSARVSAVLAEISWDQGHIEEGLERLEEAFDVLAGEEPDEDLATLAAQLGRFLYFAGRPDAALERLEFALGLAEALRLPEVLSQALNTKGVALAHVRGRPEEGFTLIRRALEIALENDLPAAAVRGYNNLASSLETRDRYAEEAELIQKGLDLARRIGDRRWELQFVGGAVQPLVAGGRWAEATAKAQEVRSSPDFHSAKGTLPESIGVIFALVHQGKMDEATEWIDVYGEAEQSKEIQYRAVYAVSKSVFLRAAGRLADAQRAAEEAFGARSELGVAHPFVKEGLVQALECALALDDRGSLEELLGEIESLKPGESTPYLQAQGARFGAGLAALRNETDRVAPGFEAAASLFRDLSMPFWLAVTLLERGEWLIGQSRASEAEPLLAEAREIFERLKARPWLERLAKSAGAPALAAADAVKST